MNKAIKMVADELDLDIKEFSVAGINYDSLFAHRWYIGADVPVDTNLVKEKIDEQLKVLNDDYRVERSAGLKEIFVEAYPTQVFYEWMRRNGKEGGQNKFPRVLKKEKLQDWEQFLRESNLLKRPE